MIPASSHVDKLPDYAKATWYLYVTNLRGPEAASGLEQEVGPLRRKLLRWALLYRASWDQVRTICQAVTEEELDRASLVGSAVFEAASRRAARRAAGPTEATLMVRRAWTLLDRAYSQCRRAMAYLRYFEGDHETLVPSLRTHPGPKGARRAKEVELHGSVVTAPETDVQRHASVSLDGRIAPG